LLIGEDDRRKGEERQDIISGMAMQDLAEDEVGQGGELEAFGEIEEVGGASEVVWVVDRTGRVVEGEDTALSVEQQGLVFMDLKELDHGGKVGGIYVGESGVHDVRYAVAGCDAFGENGRLGETGAGAFEEAFVGLSHEDFDEFCGWDGAVTIFRLRFGNCTFG